MTSVASVANGRGEPTLLERDRELAEIEERVGAAVRGAGSVLTVAGPAGSGKTRLVETAAGIARDQQLEVVSARAGQFEQEFGMGVVRQLFEAKVRALLTAEQAEVLDGAAALAGPLLGIAHDDGRLAPGGSSEPAFAAVHGLYWLTANLASRGPLVVVVDDVQWCDEPSLQFLAYLARRVDELPLLMLVALRTGDPGSSRRLVRATAGEARQLKLAPLTAAATATLVERGLGASPDQGFTRACHETTGGNPFVLAILLTTLRERGVAPGATEAGAARELGREAVSRAIARRLDALPREASALAEAVAVLGSAVELPHAARLADLDDTTAADAADMLTAAEILATSRPLEFTHPLIAEGALGLIPSGRRALVHGRAAAILKAAGVEAERIAIQLLSAEPGAIEDAAGQLQRAGRAALNRGAPDVTVRYLTRALREPVDGERRAELLHELGSSELRIGEPAGLEHLAEALELVPAGPAYAEVARELSFGMVPSGRYEEAMQVLERAVDQLGDADRELALQVEAEIATEGLLSVGTVDGALARILRWEDEVRDARTAGERALLATVSFAQAFGGSRADPVADGAARALDGGLLADQGPDAHVLFNAPFPLILADRYDEARRALVATIREARRRGSRLGVARGSAFLATLSFRQGALADAEAEARTSIEAAAPLWIVRQMAGGWLIDALVERGEVEAAEEELDAAGLSGDLERILMHDFPLASRARLRLAQSSPKSALDDLRELDRREGPGRGRNPAWFFHRGLMAEAHLALGDAEAAQAAAAQELALAEAWGAPRAVGMALRALGLATGGPEGAGRLRDAVKVLEGSGASLEHARSLVDLGAALRRAGSRQESREPLAAGMELAHRCGARPLAERAREELVATGARPRRMMRTGVDALTPSELRVVRMAADGLTNREIAQALFVTVRTVEVHLTSSYRKLDIGSRQELPAALAPGG